MIKQTTKVLMAVMLCAALFLISGCSFSDVEKVDSANLIITDFTVTGTVAQTGFEYTMTVTLKDIQGVDSAVNSLTFTFFRNGQELGTTTVYGGNAFKPNMINANSEVTSIELYTSSKTETGKADSAKVIIDYSNENGEQAYVEQTTDIADFN